MRFSLAEFFGLITLLIVMIAGLRMVLGDPEAVGAAIILSVPIHAIICDLVDRMTKAGEM